MLRQRSLALLILRIVAVCGTLDILDALVFFRLRPAHIAPARLLQGIASHLIGRQAFTMGVTGALLGLALHYFIALCWIAAFVVVARRVALLRRRPVVFGALYGLLIYAVMNFAVLPHTRNPAQPSHNDIVVLNGVLALVVFMGVMVAWLNRRWA